MSYELTILPRASKELGKLPANQRTFREELVELLDRHGVDYDERFLPG